jgi:hypothetical protein
MKKESGLKSGLLNDAIFTGVIMTLRDDTEDENVTKPTFVNEI